MGLIKELFKKYRGQGLILLATTMVSTLVGLLFIEMGRRVVNVIASPAHAAGADLHPLVWYCSIMLGAVLAGGVIGYLIEVLFARMSQSVLRDIRLKLFNHLLQLPQDFHNNNPVGQLMSLIISDVGYIGQFFSKGLLVPAMNIVMVTFFTAYLFHLNWKLAIAATITVPSVAVFLPKFNRRLARLSEAYSNSMGKMSDAFQEAFSGIGDIRSNQTYHFEANRLDGKIKEFFRINQDLAKTTGKMDFMMEVIRGSGPLLVYLYGGILCLRGELLVGTLVAAISVIYSLYGPVGSFVSFLQEWRQVKVRFDKLNDYLSLTPESDVFKNQGPKITSKEAILFDNVQFGFNDREMLLKDLTFRANPGKGLAIVGTSGSGKSLTAALISRIYRPLSGKIILGEHDIQALRLYDLRSRIGYVSQTPFIFNDTIKVNILYSLLRQTGGDSDRLEEWIDFSGLHDIDNLSEINSEIIRVVKEVGLFDDIYELGLRSKLMEDNPETASDLKRNIIEARKRFIKEMTDTDLQHVEHYREDKFLEYCTICENLVFCPSAAIIDGFGSIAAFCLAHLNDQLRESSLLEKLFNIGIHLAREDSFLLEQLYKKKSPLLSHLGFSKEDFETKLKVNEKIALAAEGPILMSNIDALLVGDILDLAYNHIPGKWKEALLNDAIKEEILEARRFFQENLPAAVKDKIKFFDPEQYLEPLSLRENLIFGNINPLRKKTNETLNALIRKVVSAVGIEDQILNIGLEFNVGERGNKLSGGQRQKVAIARALLKNPSMVILDEATASLDGASQARIIALVKEKLKDKTVISIAHRLNTIKDYDKIIVFDKGRIVEQGTFDELINTDGLFKKLFYESN